MKEQPNDLWRGGPWEQPSPSFPTPPPVVVPARRPPVLRVRRRRRTLLPFLALFLLVVGLSLGTVAVRWLLPWDDEPLTPHLSEQEERDPFAALERAETGTGVQVQISQREGEVMDAVEIYEKCVPSVVSIQADGEGEYSTGTGVVMSADGYILTNAHVVADSLRMSVLLSDGRVMEARLVGADAGEDLAVLKVEASGLTPAEFGDSDRLRCGEMVVAIGDPLGYRTSITQGIVSALNRTVPVDGVELQVIQTSAPINFGNSGGALINDRGQVVGITTLKVVAQDSTVEGLAAVLLKLQRETDLFLGVFQVGVQQVADLVHITRLHGLVDCAVLQNAVDGLDPRLLPKEIGRIGMGIQIFIDPNRCAIPAGEDDEFMELLVDLVCFKILLSSAVVLDQLHIFLEVVLKALLELRGVLDCHGGLWCKADLHDQAQLKYLIQLGPVERPYPAALAGDILHKPLRHQAVEGLFDRCGADPIAGAEIAEVDLLPGGQIFLDDVFSDVVISHIHQCVAGNEMRTAVHG